ncbi:MAG: MFS transporter, partial [Microbacterium sp.]
MRVGRLSVLALGMFAVGTDGFVVAGLLPPIAEELGVSVEQAAMLITVFALAYALGSPLCAALFGGWSRTSVLVGGLLLLTVANLLTAVAPTYEVALLTRLLAGAGAAMFAPTASATAASVSTPRFRARALAIVLAGLTSATALGAPLGTWIGGAASWRLAMWCVSGLAMIAMFATIVWVRAVPRPPVVRLSMRLAPLRDVRVAVTVLTTLLVMAGLYTVYTYVAVVFAPVTGGDGRRLAGLLVVFGVAATIGNLSGGMLTDRLGERRV